MAKAQNPAAAQLGRRIREARERARLTQEELGEIVGTTGSAVTNWEGGTRQPPYSTLLALARALDVSLGWLSGESASVTGASGVGELSLEQIARELFAAVERQKPGKSERQSPVILVPLLPNATLSAGPGGIREDAIPYLPAPGEQNHSFTAVEVVGDCMETEIRAGDVAVVDTTVDGTAGDIVAAEHDGEYLVKWLRRRNGNLYLEANQPGYEPLLVDESTRILGVVRWSGRRH